MRRRGFTLIELLVVIGILILLVGIAGYGLSKVIGTSKVASTRVTLENARSMLNEYEMVSKGLGRQPAGMFDPGGTFVTAPTVYNVWRDADPGTPGDQAAPAPPGNISQEAIGSTTPLRYNAPALLNTQRVMELLLQAPNNKAVFAQLPASQLMERIPAGLNSNFMFNATSRAMTPPLILDSWGNPILFVPSGGLYNITSGDVTRNLAIPSSPAQPNDPLRSPDNRPFFASAGPDGDFSKADDNLYSFEN